MLGLYGLQNIEDCVLAGLVTGEPVLLVGLHGSAKTLMCERLAEALGLKFHAYDASKALFEDVIGFPNPKKLMAGKVDYIPTPISIWDKEFILIDEISRASPQMQSKWLEIIRSRRVMGKRAKKTRFIFSAMNPPGYLGTIPLDAALAGRFSFIIKIPEIKEMDIPDIASIIEHVDIVEAPEIKSKKFKPTKEASKEIRNFLAKAREIYLKMETKYSDEIQAYLLHLTGALMLHNLVIDGRRISMIRRNILSLLSVKACKTMKIEFTDYELNDYFFECLKNSLPFEVLGEKVSPEILKEIHKTAIEVLSEKSEIVEARLDLSRTINPFEMSDKILKYHHILPPHDVERFISEVISELESPREAESSQIPAFFGLLKILFEFQNGKIKLSPNTTRNIVEKVLPIIYEGGLSWSESYFTPFSRTRTRIRIEKIESFLKAIESLSKTMRFKFDLNTIEGYLTLQLLVSFYKVDYKNPEKFSEKLYSVMSLINHYLVKE